MTIRSFLAMFVLAASASVSQTAMAGSGLQDNGEQKASHWLAHLAAANSALRLNEVGEARRWLSAIPESDRHWEWRLLNGRADSSEANFPTGEWNPVRLDLSKDGEQLAIAGSDGNVRIVHTDTLELLREWKAADQAVYAARFSPDRMRVATCSRDGKIIVWSLESGDKVWEQASGGQGLADLAFSPDGKQLLFCSWYRGPETVLGFVSLWNAETGETSWKSDFGVKPVVVARFSANGESFAVGTWDGLVGVWSTENPGEPRVLDFSDKSQYSAIDDIAFSPGGDLIAAAPKNGSPRIWSADGSSPPIDLTGQGGAIFAVAFSPDGRKLLSGGTDGVLSVWDVGSRLLEHRFYGHENRIGSIVVPSTGSHILTASADRTIRRWSMLEARTFESPDAGKYTYGMVVSGNGQEEQLICAGQSETTISVWNTNSKTPVRHFPGTEGTVNYLDGNGTNLVAGGNWSGDVALWDVTTGREVRRMEGTEELGGLQQCALSDDSRWIASATNRNQVVVWEAQTGKLAKILPVPDGCWGIDFSPDSSRLLTGDGKGTVHCFLSETWEPAWQCPANAAMIESLRVAGNGEWLAAGCADGTLLIVDMKSGTLLHRTQGHSQRIWSVDISPDGQRIATGSADTRVRIWDAANAALLLTLADFSDPVYNVCFSSDGQSLFVNSLGSRITRIGPVAGGK
jgi:WD40 repeat protein